MPNGRCRMHGGASLAGAEHPNFKHGRTSRYRHLLSEKLQEHVPGDNPLDVLPELEIQRVLFAHYLNRFNATGVLLPADDIERLMQWAGEITRTAERVNKMRNESALTKAEVMFLAARVADIVSEFIPNADRQRAFIERLFGGIESANQPALAEHAGEG